MTKYDLIYNALEYMEDDTLVDLWNSYCDKDFNDYPIYYMEQFDDLMSGYLPHEIIDAVNEDNFSIYEPYFKRDFYDELFFSFDEPLPEIDADDLIDYIIGNEESFGLDELREVLYSEEYDKAS